MEETRKVSVPNLDVDNYDIWAIKMELALETMGLWDCVLLDLPADANEAVQSKGRRARADVGLCLEVHLSTLSTRPQSRCGKLWKRYTRRKAKGEGWS